ncbi:MAG: hydantoinase/oxoprolinase family protein [Terriglobales bacterium]
MGTDAKYYCYSDSGGTFTDTFVMTDQGEFFSGKASTTPGSLDGGHINSVANAVTDNLKLSLEEFFPRTEVVGFGTTAIINTVVTRVGIKTGAIVTKGFEQVPYMGRGAQTYTEMSWEDILHVATHRKLEDLVPLKLMKGVTERVDCYGEVKIPLYVDEVRQAARELIAEDVEAIIIVFLYCFLNPDHELTAKRIVEEEVAASGKSIEVFTSYEISPGNRECNRFNATAIEAYAGKIARRSMRESEKRIQELGGKKPMQVMLSHGGLCQISQAKMVETAMSGPVGGVLGGAYIGQLYGIDNMITTDVGGTSFDVGLVTKGRIHLNLEPVVARFLINVPYADVKSIGAGGGTIAFIDPMTGRLRVGPKSAGAVPGPACYGKGGESPTVTDADFVLGYLNPKYFLGGRVPVGKELAEKVIREKIAKPLGLSVEEAAWGIKTIIDTQMDNYCRNMISSRGYAVEDYTLLAFGGAGPSHAAGYTQGTNYKNVMMFPYSAVFCAFGAATADFSHQFIQATNALVPGNASASTKVAVGKVITDVWEKLEAHATEQMLAEGFRKDEIHFDYIAFVRYYGQLDEILVHSPVAKIHTAEDMDRFIAAFEKEYSSIYTSAGTYPQAGYLSRHVGLIASVKKAKPKLIPQEKGSKKPSANALKEVRPAFFGRGMVDTKIYELSELKAGNVIPGPAVIEHVNTNFVVPPDRYIEIDEYQTLWLKRGN